MAKDIRVKIIGDTSSFDAAIRKSQLHAGSFGKSLDRLAKASIVAAGAAGLGALAFGLRTGIKEFAEHERAAAQTMAVLKSTAAVSGMTAKSVDELARAVSNYSGMDDEAVQAAENMLLTFTQIRDSAGKNNDIFTQATKLTADLSVAMGIDMPKAALQLGKALNDPERGMSRLQRIGVAFTESQKDQVAAMMKTGDVIGAQKVILAELTREFGGSAKAAGETLPGQLNRLRETFNNLAGDLVGEMAPAILTTTRRLTDWLQNTQNQERIQRDFNAVVDTAKGLIRDLTPFVKGAASAARTFSDDVGGAKNALELLAGVVAAWKATALITSLTNIGAAAAGVGGAGTAGAAGGAAGSVSLLRRRLLLLAKMGPIVIGIELVLNRKKLNDWLNEKFDWRKREQAWLEKHVPGFKAAASALGTALPATAGASGGAAGAALEGLGRGMVGSPGGKVQGKTGPITAGLSALEQASGARVSGDFATHGHAKHSYHYKGEAMDLAPDPAVWARLFARKAMFAELLGPWGLYNWGVQFFDAKLQAQHMDHIHVAYTGGSAAIKKAFAGGSVLGPGATSTPTTTAGADRPTHDKPKPKPKQIKVAGFELPVPIRTAIAEAALTVKDSADDLKALAQAKRFIESKLGSLKGEKKIQALDALKSVNDQIAGIENDAAAKQAARQAATQAKQLAALKTHMARLKAVVDARRATFEDAFSNLAAKALTAFDQATARGLADIGAKFDAETDAEKDLRLFRSRQLSSAKAAARAEAEALEDPVERAAKLRELDLADEEAALQEKADNSREARNAEKANAESAYNDLRANQRDQLDAWLDEQRTRLETGKSQWAGFWEELVKKAGLAGTDVSSSFWKSFDQAGGRASGALGGLSDAQVAAAVVPVGATTGGSTRTGYVVGGVLIQPPHLAAGGLIAQSGLAVVHRGETVTPAGRSTGSIVVNFNGPVYGADADELARKIQRSLLQAKLGGRTIGLS